MNGKSFPSKGYLQQTSFIAVALWKVKMAWKAQDNALSIKPRAISTGNKEEIVLRVVENNFAKYGKEYIIIISCNSCEV